MRLERYSINKWTCCFSNKEIENEYFNESMKIDRKHMKPLIIVVAVIYMLFSIPEYYFLISKSDFQPIVLIRLLTFVIIISLFFYIKTGTDNKKLCYMISLVEIILASSYFTIIYQFTHVEFFITLMDLLLLLSIVFIIPNVFLYKIIVSFIIYFGFFYFKISQDYALTTGELLAGITYTFVLLIIFITTHYRINYYDRIKFLNEKELKILSEIDHLTGINNRAKFDQEIIKWIKLKERYNYSVSLILMDFDEFKSINDKYGHSTGDRILKEGIELTNQMIRDTDVFARWGGEEFVILLPETEKIKAVSIAERIRENIHNADFGIEDRVTCSFGVTEVQKEDNIYQVFDRVDELLYMAKKQGRNIVIS